MNELNIASISDIHLGHPKNRSNEIIKNLYDAFPDNAETEKLDLILIPGDIFDSLLSLPDENIDVIHMWISDMLYMCARYDIVLRILAGTPSHDWNQSELFITIAKSHNIPVDVKYFKEISVEYIEKLGINVLYVPDEANDTCDKTLQQVKEILIAKGLDKVDYAVMHGQFEYQIPAHFKAHTHSSEEYLKLVTGLIFIGHDHTHSGNDRIIAQGSFDRLTHGYESPKGHVRATIDFDGNHSVKFIENVNAKTFKTIECFDLTLEETINKIDKNVLGLRDNSFIRVSGNSGNPIFTNMGMLVQRYPLYIWSKLVKDLDDEIEEVDNYSPDYVPITITKDNIKDQLMSRILKNPPNPEILEIISNLLDEVS